MIEDINDVLCNADDGEQIKIREVNHNQCQLDEVFLFFMFVLLILLIIAIIVSAILSYYTMGCRKKLKCHKAGLKLYLSYADQDEEFARRIKKELYSTFPGLEILSSEDVAAGDVIVVERISLVHKCHLVMIIISQHVDKWTEMDILAGYADPLHHRGKVENSNNNHLFS